MKASAFLTIAILVLGLLPGFFYQNRITAARSESRALASEAEKLGIRLEASAEPRTRKRPREGVSRASNTVADDFLRFAMEMENRESGAMNFDPDMNRRGIALMADLMDLGPAELRRVIAELRDADGLSAETRRDLIGYVMLTLSSAQPETAAMLAVESLDFLGDSAVGEQAMMSSIQRWAELDAASAVSWLAEAGRTHPELREDDMKRCLISGVAANDPAQAFAMLDSLGLEDVSSGVESIMQSASHSSEQRDAVLGALRDHLEGLGSEADRLEIRDDAYAALARTLDVKDFDGSVSWIEKAGLSAPEMAAFATGLGYFDTGDKTGNWIEWMSGRLELEDLEDPVQELMGEWTQQDYLAAGRWLAEAPEGAGKVASVAAYAEAVAEYEPQVAEQWAMTMPDNWRREVVLRTIHENWPENDSDGAAAFAAKHGIK